MTESQGPARGYSWPPFEAGNSASLAHGARSPRKVAALAEQIESQARASESWPKWLDDPSYEPAVRSWAWAESVCQLLREYLAELDVGAMLTERASEDVDEQRTKGRTRRRTSAQRHHSALEMSRRWESIAAGRRKDIGLDPISRAKLGRDVAIGTAVAGQLDRLRGVGSELVDRFGRAALSAADKPADSTRPVDAERPVEGQPDPGHAGVGYDASEIEGGGSNGQS